MLLAAILSPQNVVIDIVFALAMLGTGFTLAWFLSKRNQRPNPSGLEQARDALAKIQGLATSVALDVGEHSSKMQEASNELHELTANGSDSVDREVLATVANMLEANEKLQQKLASAEERLQQQAQEIEGHVAEAHTDALTDLPNRRAFDSTLDECLDHWQQHQTPYCMFLIDVDHFKKFNDVHGHLAGDAVLRGVGDVLKQSTRSTDLACRYGGEEFAVIMPGTTSDIGQHAAECVRQAIEAATFHFEGKDLNVTVSAGLAEIQPGEDNDSFIRRADEGLYASKEAGRNFAHFNDGQRNVPITCHEEKVATTDAKTISEATSPSQPSQQETAITTETLDRLPDRTVFTSELQRRVAEALRFDVPLSVIAIHVHDFGEITSKYGAAIGHLILDTVAQYLDILLRDMDLLARYDDGEFRIMLPGTQLDEAAAVARRIRDSVSACVIPLKGSQLQLAVSQGIATIKQDDAIETILARGDAALFQAKAGGANSVYLHNGEDCSELENASPTTA